MNEKENREALSERLPEDIFIAVHQAIGHASTCWTDIDHAGTFDAVQASYIAFELCHLIADRYERSQK